MTLTPVLRPRILIIEDDPARISTFERWLEATPYVVVRATSGGQAMGFFQHGAQGIAGICLDHDLNTQPRTEADEWVSGSNVVSRICAKVPKTVPILVHSMNVTRAPQMVKRLIGAGFSVTRIRMSAMTEPLFHQWLADVGDAWDLHCPEAPTERS